MDAPKRTTPPLLADAPPQSLRPERFGQLAHSSLVSELGDGELAVLASVMNEHRFEDGQVLATEGATQRMLYVLLEGSIEVCRTYGPKQQTVHTMKAGEVAGTRDFVDGLPRQALLKAKGSGCVLTLDVADFESLLETYPQLVYKIMRGIFRITHSNLMRMNAETDQLQDYLLRTGNRH